MLYMSLIFNKFKFLFIKEPFALVSYEFCIELVPSFSLPCAFLTPSSYLTTILGNR